MRIANCQLHEVAKRSIIENVRGLVLDHVSVNGKPVDAASITAVV